MNRIRMPCPLPVICLTCCCRRTHDQAQAQPPLALAPRVQGPQDLAQVLQGLAPMDAVVLGVEQVSKKVSVVYGLHFVSKDRYYYNHGNDSSFRVTVVTYL